MQILSDLAFWSVCMSLMLSSSRWKESGRQLAKFMIHLWNISLASQDSPIILIPSDPTCNRWMAERTYELWRYFRLRNIVEQMPDSIRTTSPNWLYRRWGNSTPFAGPSDQNSSCMVVMYTRTKINKIYPRKRILFLFSSHTVGS